MNTVELFDLRLPIMIHAGYKLYHRHFFSQFLDIFVYGILGTFLLILVTSVINKPLLSAIFGKDCDFTLSQMVMFSCISVIVDPMAIRSLKPDNKMFYLLLGVSVLGNSTAVDLFSPASRLAYVSNNTVTATTYGYLALNFLLDLLCGLLLAVAVGLLSSYLSKMARRGDSDCQYYEPGIAVGGTCLVYYMTSYFTLSTLFSVVTCCLMQQRYVFGNFSMKSVMAIEDGLDSLAMLLDGLFFVVIGYFLKQVAVKEIWRQVLVLLAVFYLMKAVICLLLAFLLNISRKTPVKEILRTAAIMVFAGSRGPRGWALMLTFQGGEHFNLFHDAHLLLSTFSLVLETLIARSLYKKVEESSEEEEEVDEGKEVSSGFVKWFLDREKELNSFLVAGDYDMRKRELEIAQHIKKLEQHSFYTD